MNYKNLIFIFVGFLLLPGCRHKKLFLFKNKTNKEAIFEIKYKEETQLKNVHSNIDKNQFGLGENDGWGKWTNQELDNLASQIDTLILKSYRNEIVITNQKELFEILKKNRCLLKKNLIIIKIK